MGEPQNPELKTEDDNATQREQNSRFGLHKGLTEHVVAEPSKPTYRPSERFWPYVELAEAPTEEELASLDPDLHDALFGPTPRAFSVTLSFPSFEGDEYARAVELARATADYREVGSGSSFRHRARFFPDDARRLHALFEIVGRLDACDVLIDDRPVPYARELWLPLIWFLIPR